MPAHFSRIKTHPASSFNVPQEPWLELVNNWIIARFKLLAFKRKAESKFSRTLKAIISYDRQGSNIISKLEKYNTNHCQIISTKEALPSHFLDIATDLLLSTLCESTLKLFFSGVMIIQEILSSTRAMSIMTFQLFRLPLEHEV